VDDSGAAVPDVPSSKRRNYAITPNECDSIASVSRAEWAACYKDEMPYLIRYLVKCFDDADIRDAADAAHSAFAELFTMWNTVRSPRAWLRTVAFRQMLRQPVKGEYPLDTAQLQQLIVSSASAQLELREQERTVIAALHELPLTQRQVFALMYDKFSYREIAEIMDMTEPAVRKNAERAKMRIKEFLKPT
jgi:RNA polymerase sigma factor (sigma-70 family)